MATIEDVRPAILESEAYNDVVMGQPLEVTATLLDLQNDTLPFVETVRKQGAQAFGMLFFQSDSTECPKSGVLWLQFKDGLVLATEHFEVNFLKVQPFMDLCFRMAATFLDTLAHRDPKYSALAVSTVH